MFPCKATKQWRIVEIQLLATEGWKWGCQPFSCPRSQNVTHCRKEVYATCCQRNPCLLWNLSLHSPPEAWGPWERQHASPARSAYIMLAKDRVVVSKLWITGYSLWSRLSYRCDSCKPMKKCRDWAFSLRGLEVGLPAFQLTSFAKCHALPKRGLCDMLSKESRPFVKSKPALPTRSLRSLRAAARSTSSLFWLHNASKR